MLLHWVWLLWVWGADVAALICCSWALWRGGGTERIGAVIIGIGWVLTWVFEAPGLGPSLGDIIVDIAAFVGLAALAIKSKRLWVTFAAILQFNAVFTHFIHPFTLYGKYSYATVVGFWSGYGLLICLMSGIVGYRRRLQVSGVMSARSL